jgi:hypothetical protein
MSDDLDKRRPQDASRINLSEPWEVAYWTKALKLTEKELRAAVAAVGDRAEAVRAHLASSKS